MLRSRTMLVVLMVAAAGLLPQQLRAQGFFEQLFGGQPLPQEPPRPYPGAGQASPYASYSTGGTYRTLCVRLCDGYYFPISFSTVRSEFARDADRCAASCGSEARLFYHPNPGGDVEAMVDLTGVAYAGLPTAFKYRSSLVNDCACRPQPWTDREAERHRSYALGAQPAAAATGKSEQSAPEADVAAAGTSSQLPKQPQVSAFDTPSAVMRPQPVSRYVLPSPATAKRGSPAGLFR